MEGYRQKYPLSNYACARKCWEQSYHPHHAISFPDGYTIFFADGKFDNYAAYICGPVFGNDGTIVEWKCYAPKDEWYFEQLYMIYKNPYRHYSGNAFYDTANFIYENIHFRDNGQYNADAIAAMKNYIHSWCDKRDEDYLYFIYTEIYYTMLAEEQKKNAIAGALLKLAAFRNMFILGKSIEDTVSCDCASNCTKRYGNDVSPVIVILDTARACGIYRYNEEEMQALVDKYANKRSQNTTD